MWLFRRCFTPATGATPENATSFDPAASAGAVVGAANTYQRRAAEEAAMPHQICAHLHVHGCGQPVPRHIWLQPREPSTRGLCRSCAMFCTYVEEEPPQERALLDVHDRQLQTAVAVGGMFSDITASDGTVHRAYEDHAYDRTDYYSASRTRQSNAVARANTAAHARTVALQATMMAEPVPPGPEAFPWLHAGSPGSSWERREAAMRAAMDRFWQENVTSDDPEAIAAAVAAATAAATTAAATTAAATTATGAAATATAPEAAPSAHHQANGRRHQTRRTKATTSAATTAAITIPNTAATRSPPTRRDVLHATPRPHAHETAADRAMVARARAREVQIAQEWRARIAQLAAQQEAQNRTTHTDQVAAAEEENAIEESGESIMPPTTTAAAPDGAAPTAPVAINREADAGSPISSLNQAIDAILENMNKL